MLPNARVPMPTSGGTPAPGPASMQTGAQDVTTQLVDVLAKVKQVADKNGINFTDLVNKVMGEGSAAAPAGAPPPPPMQR